MSSQKNVIVQIAPGDLVTLKQGGYNLCFAKKVGSTFNVVWQSFDNTQYLSTNQIYWTPQYQIFGTNKFADSVTVVEDTNGVDILLSQQATLDQYGFMNTAISGPNPNSLTLVNNFGPIHPGVSQVVGGANGQSLSPIYVAEESIVLGTDVLTPIDQVMVWFDSQLQTSTMFSNAQSNTVVADLTNTDTVSLLYQNGTWTQTAALRQDMLGETAAPVLSLVFGISGAVSAALIATKITTYLTGVYSKFSVSVSSAKGELNVTFAEKPRHHAPLSHASGTRDDLLAMAAKALSAYGVKFTKLSAS